MGSRANIACLLRAKNNEGGLSVRATEGLPFLLSPGMDVTFVPPLVRFPRHSKVVRIEGSQGKHLVYFEDITNRNDAEQLEGHFCLVRKADLPAGYDAAEGFDVVDYSVVDEDLGPLGVVVRIEENPAHPLLVVSAEGDHDVLIPVVDEFIVSVDDDTQQIRVHIPAGLLDL